MAASLKFLSTVLRSAAIGLGMGSVGVRRAGIAALALCSALWAARANAQDGEAVRLTYDAPAGCPGESDFLEMVARDGGRLASAGNAPRTRSFAVHIEGTDAISGRLVVREGDGTEAVREMSGVRCDDVVRSLAVVVALSVEPPPPVAPASATVPGFAASNLGPERESTPVDLGAESVVLRPHQGWRVDVSFEGTLSKSSSPSNDPSLAAYVELMDETPNFYAPSIRVGAEIAADQQTDETTTFDPKLGNESTAQISLSPLPFGPQTRIAGPATGGAAALGADLLFFSGPTGIDETLLADDGRASRPVLNTGGFVDCIAYDGVDLYFVDRATKKLMAAPPSGAGAQAAPHTLVTSIDPATVFVVDRACVYWVDASAETIAMRTTR